MKRSVRENLEAFRRYSAYSFSIKEVSILNSEGDAVASPTALTVPKRVRTSSQRPSRPITAGSQKAEPATKTSRRAFRENMDFLTAMFVMGCVNLYISDYMLD